MNEELGKEYEEWLDEVEAKLPLPIPEEDIVDTNKMKVLQQIYARLGRLEDDREDLLIKNLPTTEVDAELKALRLKVQDIMNSPCPILRGDQ